MRPSPPLSGARGPRAKLSTSGFTLLEVMVAMAILGVAVVTTIQLVSQSLRLLRVAGEHQQASVLADRLLRESTTETTETQQGEEGPFAWERTARQLPIPEELGQPGQRAPGLSAITVSVRWGGNRSLEFSTLRLTPSIAENSAR